MHVIERPGSLAKMGAERMSEIVACHDTFEVHHPALESAVDESAHARYSVRSIPADCTRTKSARKRKRRGSCHAPASFSSPSARNRSELRSTMSSSANASAAPRAQISSRSSGSTSIDVAKMRTLPAGNSAGTMISENEPLASFRTVEAMLAMGSIVASRPRSVVEVSRTSPEAILMEAPATNLTRVPSSRIGATESTER